MEKLGLEIKLLLFFSAYSPLFLILCIKNWALLSNFSLFWQTKTFWFILVPFIISIISCVIFILCLFFLSKKAGDTEYTLLNYSDTASQSISYILTYIIPFLDFNLSNRYDILCIYILLSIIGIVYINSDMIYTNPLLYFRGFSAIDAEIQDSSQNKLRAIILVENENKFDIRRGDTINTALINNNYKNLLLYKSKTEVNNE